MVRFIGVDSTVIVVLTATDSTVSATVINPVMDDYPVENPNVEVRTPIRLAIKI